MEDRLSWKDLVQKKDNPLNNNLLPNIAINNKQSFDEENSTINRLNNEILKLKRKTQFVDEKDRQIEKLEAEIDEMNDVLEPLNSFVLPGGCKSAAFLHLARTICRRAERDVVSLRSKEKINENTLVYLNRLSDWLFVASRVENQENSTEVLWSPGKNK